MNFKLFAAIVFSSLVSLPTSYGDCPDTTCGSGDAVKVKFSGSGSGAVLATGTVMATMTLAGKSVSPLPLPQAGDGTVETTEATVDIKPQQVYDANLTVTVVGLGASSTAYLTGSFEVVDGCGYTLHIRNKPLESPESAYSEWTEASACSVERPSHPGAETAREIIQIRLVKKAEPSGTGSDGGASNGDSSSGGSSGGSGGVAPPSVPPELQDSAPGPNSTAPPFQLTPISFHWSHPLGANSGSEGFNTGLLSLEGMLISSLADLKNLEFRNPGMEGVAVAMVPDADPFLQKEYVRQIHLFDPAVDIDGYDGDEFELDPNIPGATEDEQLAWENARRAKSGMGRLIDVLSLGENSGFTIRFYEEGSFDVAETQQAGAGNFIDIHPILSGASRTLAILPIPSAGDHSGGIRVIDTGSNLVPWITEYVTLSNSRWRITRIVDGVVSQTKEYTSLVEYDDVSDEWQRTDDTEEKQEGVLVSKSHRVSGFLCRRDSPGTPVMESYLMPRQEIVYDTATTFTTTTWEPHPDFPGKVKSMTRSDGSWEAYSYYTGTETELGADISWRGELKETLKPWNGQPPGPEDASAADSESTVVTYGAPSTTPGAHRGQIVMSRTTTVPGQEGPVIVSDWARPAGTVSFDDLVDLLEDAQVDESWLPTVIQVRQDASQEFASATESLVSSSFTYLESVVPGCPWVGDSFASLDPEGNGHVTGYERGVFSSSVNGGWTFTANTPVGPVGSQEDWGAAIRSVTVKVAGFGAPADGEATREVVIRSADGKLRVKELSIKSGTTWSVATTTTYDYPQLWSDGSAKEVVEKQDGRIVSRQLASSAVEITSWDEQNIETRTVRDSLGRTKTVTRVGVSPQPNIVTTYDYSGRTTSVLTTAGGLSRTQQTVVDLMGRVISATDPSGAVTGTYYPPDSQLETLTTLPGGLTRLVTRNSSGRTVSVTGTAVIDESYEYTAMEGGIETYHNLGDEGGGRGTFTSEDLAGRLSSRVVSGPQFYIGHTYTYHPGTSAVASDLELGGATKLHVQPQANSSLKYSGYDADSTAGLQTGGNDRLSETRTYYSFEEDFWWQVSSRKVYDQEGSATSAITSTSKRCLHGNPDGYASKSITISPAGETTTVTTSISGTTLTQTETREGASVDAVSVNVNGLLVSHKGHDSSTSTLWEYNPFGQPVMETSPRGAVTQKSYYPDGSLASTTDAAGKVTLYAYFPPSHVSAGKLATVTNPLGKTTTYLYSPIGKVTEVAGTAAYKVTYEYDAFGGMKKMFTWRDGATADSTEWVYEDVTGRLLSKIDAAGQHTDYTYYPTGKLATRTWARGVSTTYSYNSFGDLTGINYSDATPNVAFGGHDRLGRPTSITQTGAGTEIVSYQPSNSVVAARYYTSGHSLLPGLGIRYTAMDAVGRSAGFMETSDSDSAVARTVGYGYDASGRLTSITDGGQNHIYSYHANSSRVSTIHSSTGTTAWFRESRYYDIPGRLVGIHSDRMTGTILTSAISSHSYDYDNLGRRTKNTTQDGSFFEYGYNDRSEVTSATRKTTGGTVIPQLGASYSYDGIGNRLTSTSPVMGDHTYTPNSLNQYSSITTGSGRTAIGRAPAGWTVQVAGTNATRTGEIYHRAITAANTAAPVWQSVITRRDTGAPSMTSHFWYAKTPTVPTYDVDGNLTNDGRWVYSWNAENRLIQMETTPQATAAGHPYTKLKAVYDWQGRRIARTVWQGGPAGNPTFKSNHRWLYDGWNVIAEFSGTVESGGPLIRLNTYTWGLDLSGTLQGAGGVGGLLVQTAVVTGVIERASFDGNGNIAAWTKSTASAPTSRREYDAFGNTLMSEGSTPCSFGFSTKMQDVETGLYYYGYRYYDPLNGRWHSKDPIAETGGKNLYGFVNNYCTGDYDVLGLQNSRSCSITIRFAHGDSVNPTEGIDIKTESPCAPTLEVGCSANFRNSYRNSEGIGVPPVIPYQYPWNDQRFPPPHREGMKVDPNTDSLQEDKVLERLKQAVTAANAYKSSLCSSQCCCENVRIFFKAERSAVQSLKDSFLDSNDPELVETLELLKYDKTTDCN